MNKVLIITYYWPPSGGAGVQRWLKFSKYLPEFGWEPVILTVDPEYAAYPVTDDSLAANMPLSVKVIKHLLLIILGFIIRINPKYRQQVLQVM